VDRCEWCGFEYELVKAANAGALIVSQAGLFCGTLNDRTLDVRTRPAPDVWSPLEYG
jgi:hypothetical protein